MFAFLLMLLLLLVLMESPGARQTTVGLVRRVRPLVFRQMIRAGERAEARPALEHPLPGVDSHVSLQVVVSTESLAAVLAGALERAFFGHSISIQRGPPAGSLSLLALLGCRSITIPIVASALLLLEAVVVVAKETTATILHQMIRVAAL